MIAIMKNKFSLLLTTVVTVMALAGLQSCKKWTEVDPSSLYSSPQAFSDVSNAYSAIIGVYDELQGDNGYGIRISMYYPYDSDEAIVSGNIDNGRRGVGRYQLLLTNSEIANPFRQLYRGIEKANLCIEQIPKMSAYADTASTGKELRRLYAEALTLRAQFYFELIRNWGDVPAPMIPSYQQTNLFIGQSDRDSTYDKILNDLAVAKTMLPWRSEVARNERIT
jgi:starch-binding outer membrane protein, SusD/RagB family